MFDAQEALKALTLRSNPINTLVAMVGAHSFGVNDKESSITFKFKAKALNKANYCTITLDQGKDLYNLKMGRVWGLNVKTVFEEKGLFFDQLKPIFENETHLYLSL